MRTLFLGLFIVTQVVCTEVFATAKLKGSWQFTEIIYRGQVLPRPNPELNLIWTFFENGTERLFWNRNGEEGFCERFATFQVVEDYLEESVFSVNPQNAIECGRDPDMQVGRKTKTKIEIGSSSIHLHFQLGDESIIYILKEVPTF